MNNCARCGNPVGSENVLRKWCHGCGIESNRASARAHYWLRVRPTRGHNATKCRTCGALFDRPFSGQAKRCRDCRKEARRAAHNKANAKYRASGRSNAVRREWLKARPGQKKLYALRYRLSHATTVRVQQERWNASERGQELKTASRYRRKYGADLSDLMVLVWKTQRKAKEGLGEQA